MVPSFVLWFFNICPREFLNSWWNPDRPFSIGCAIGVFIIALICLILANPDSCDSKEESSNHLKWWWIFLGIIFVILIIGIFNFVTIAGLIIVFLLLKEAFFSVFNQLFPKNDK